LLAHIYTHICSSTPLHSHPSPTELDNANIDPGSTRVEKNSYSWAVQSKANNRENLIVTKTDPIWAKDPGLSYNPSDSRNQLIMPGVESAASSSQSKKQKEGNNASGSGDLGTGGSQPAGIAARQHQSILKL
jgi:hypothetical protein